VALPQSAGKRSQPCNTLGCKESNTGKRRHNSFDVCDRCWAAQADAEVALPRARQRLAMAAPAPAGDANGHGVVRGEWWHDRDMSQRLDADDVIERDED
jgi:hypothetical protein